MIPGEQESDAVIMIPRIESDNHNSNNDKENQEDSDWSNFIPLLEFKSKMTDDEDQKRRKKVIKRWHHCMKLVLRNVSDPWQKFEMQHLPILRAVRYRYSATQKKFVTDDIEIKMCMEPFAKGAMRECFRVKKVSSLSTNCDWSLAQNYVAKRYMQPVDRQVIFDDVRLQMDCKLWAEEYNRQKVPKKIDVVQICAIEISDLPESPLYHLEHFIEGEYVKYNSNSGFVSDKHRHTPQSFSHFTFERSGHQMICVDIQGVGTLYTDPQIHTVNGLEYGDGNLGTRGMALFFHSHRCNNICLALGLTEFDLHEDEKHLIMQRENATHDEAESTKFARNREPSICLPIIDDLYEADAMENLRQRSASIRHFSFSRSPNCIPPSIDEIHSDNCFCDSCIPGMTACNSPEVVESDSEDHDIVSSRCSPPTKPKFGHRNSFSSEVFEMRRKRLAESMCSSNGGSSRVTCLTDREAFWASQRLKTVPAGINEHITRHNTKLSDSGKSVAILGQIHVELARYHESGRFVHGEAANMEKAMVLKALSENIDNNLDMFYGEVVKYDHAAALYHVDVAMQCGNLEAILTIANIVYDLPHDLLKNISKSEAENVILKNITDHEAFAFELMLNAAEMGDKGAIIFVANCYETGQRMGANQEISYPAAISWLQKSVGFADDEEGAEMYRLRYETLAKIAHFYQVGGFGLKKDLQRAYELYNEAGEVAMEAAKGKLASRYYELAEMCVE